MIKFDKKAFILLCVFFLFCFVYRYLYSDLIYSLDLRDYDLIDKGKFTKFKIDYLDDTAKYERSIVEGRSLFFSHGGQMLETLILLELTFLTFNLVSSFIE